MKTFKDSKDRSWDIEVNGETIHRVQTLCDLLLTELIGGTAATDLAANPIRLFSVLYAVCKPMADERKIDEAAFRAAIGGDSLDGAIDALIDEVVGFFPKSRRSVAQALVSKGREVENLLVTQTLAKINGASPESLLAKPPGESAGNSLESSESIPAD
jgi:hypothetical protein